MRQRIIGLCAVLLMCCVSSFLKAETLPGLAVRIDVHHVTRDTWRVDYRFAEPVTAIKFDSVGELRQKAWKVVTPGMRMNFDSDHDIIDFDGKPFRSASIEIRTFDGLAPKSYAPFNRFSDGGTAFFLAFLQGEVYQGTRQLSMLADTRLHGLAQENVIAPPPNKRLAGGERGYAYFGPARAVRSGSTQFLIDPATPAWMRETFLDAGARLSAYYEKAYQRPLKDELLIMLSVSGSDASGLSMKGGAVMGQLSYRFDGKATLVDHPKYREAVAQLVGHELAHIWQMNIARGGMGEDDPWIHEGGAEAMSLDGVLQTGLWNEAAVAAYTKQKSAICDKLGNSVDSYDGIYACGLVRFNKLGVAIVPLWRTMMEVTENKGDVYSASLIDAIVLKLRSPPSAALPSAGAGQ
ncbi:MAG: hypothetical protein JWP59_4101 [Massilia sp.]|nr:hypothetical protein [Massilia sp.]